MPKSYARFWIHNQRKDFQHKKTTNAQVITFACRLATYNSWVLHFLHYHFLLRGLGDVGWQPTILECCISCIITFCWEVLGVQVGNLQFLSLAFLALSLFVEGSWGCRLATYNSWVLHFLHYHFLLRGLGGVGWQPTILECCISCVITFCWEVLGV